MIAYLLLIIFNALLVTFVYTKLIQPLFYWRNRNIFYVSPIPRFISVFLTSKPFAHIVRTAYLQHPSLRYYGSYQFLSPSLFVRDLDLIKQITVKDFEHFTDHLGILNEQTDPVLFSNLFSLKGQKWREMRPTLSPTFTASKMKSMYALIQQTAETYADYLEKNIENLHEIEMKKFGEKYANDVIANCAFGIELNTLQDEKNEFYLMGRIVTDPSRWQVVKSILNGMFPKLFQLLGISAFPPEISRFFLNIIRQTIAYRQENNIVRPDMIHLLMEARKGRLSAESDVSSNEPGFATVQESHLAESSEKQLKLTDEVITAQALVFFLAGFSTSSTIISFLCYELTINPKIQAKLQEEIDEQMKNSEVTYEILLKMKYLDQVVCETLRKWTPAFALNRVCTKDYVLQSKLPHEKNVLIEEGCLVTIPVFGIHYDKDFFPDPENFQPERFSDENKGRIVPGSYIPFGSGPRNCIGSRFALLEIKALIVQLFYRFNFVRIAKTEVPIKLSKRLTIEAENGVWVGIEKRQKI